MAEQPNPAEVVKETNYEELKGTLIFVVIAIFLGSAFYSGISVKGLVILISGIVLVLGFDAGEILGKERKASRLAGYGISAVAWILAFAIAELSEGSGTLYFIMFSAAIASFMEIDNALIILSVSGLSIWAFGSSFLGFLVMITVGFFIYAAKTDTIFGIVMMIPLLIVGWFVGSGWGDIVNQEVHSISTQVGTSTGISTESIGYQINSMLNDTWLMVTDPNAWYEKKFATEGNRDTGATASALEITRIEALPPTVMPKDTFDLMVEVTNKGNKDATNTLVGANGDSLTKSCGKIEGKYCISSCAEGEAVATTCSKDRPLGKIAPLETRFDSFTFTAPECPGTYSVKAGITYDYTAEATLNLQMINRNYYEELLVNNKMKWIKELSIASAGPFKMSLRTDRDQPIPDKESDLTKQQIFKVYIGLLNEHSGKATYKSATLKIPEVLEIITKDDTGADDPTCTIRPVKGAKPEGGYLPYTTIDTGLVDGSRTLNAQEWRYYKCRFQLSDKEQIQQIKTYFIKAEINYNFNYEQAASVTVRKQSEAVPPKCKKAQEASVSKLTGPQPKDVILSELAKEIVNCYKNNYGWSFGGDDTKCGDFTVDIDGCKGDVIKASDLVTAISAIKDGGKEALSQPLFLTLGDPNSDALSGKQMVVIYINSDKGAVFVEPSEKADTATDSLFGDMNIYPISLYYARFTIPYLTVLLPPSDGWQEMRVASWPGADNACPGGPGMVCGATPGTATAPGVCKDPTGTYTDKCSDAKTLTSYLCSSDKCTTATQTCIGACSGGVCSSV